MTDHWAEFGPPVYVSVARYLGVQNAKRRPAAQADNDREDSADDFENDMRAMAPEGWA